MTMLDQALAPYLRLPAAALLAAASLATGGMGMAVTPPEVPAGWRVAGWVLLGAGALVLLGAFWLYDLRKRRLRRASRLMAGPGMPMRLRVKAGARVADLSPVKKDGPELLATWPAAPEGQDKRPARRVAILPASFGQDDSLQAEVWIDPVDPRLVVIRTKLGCLISER
jgi:hypothetical protein